ncbi:SurA N-terminal domain-containing protein [Litchfieldia alkalitelluris]|uniref:SurA N-terminal domain-containing protein n=1 Tax=Litchfieldia alkalitelluris TaxID=304268 RepID=UPI0014731D2C|nr:SurA N-terminal domain-containing protein [Litchfieldia alkalitelluris]
MLFQKKSFLVICLMLVLVLASCGNKEEATDNSSDSQNEAVASVNGIQISETDFLASMEQSKLTYAQQGIDVESLGDEEKKLLEEQALEQLINMELLVQAADDQQIAISDEEIEENLQEIRAQFETEDAFTEALETNNLTEEKLKEQLVKDLKINQFITENIDQTEATATDEEIQEMYDMYAEQSEEEMPALEEVRDQIEMTIVEQKQNEAVLALIEKLKQDSEIEKFI